MFRFDNYCEKWAEKFKPISHNPAAGSRDKAFYRMDSFNRIESLCSSISTAKSPAMAVVTQIDAETDGQANKFLRFTYNAFFLVRQANTSAVDKENAAAEAKEEGLNFAEKFLAYVLSDKKGNLPMGKAPNPDLAGLDIAKASIFTAPAIFGNWWATELIIENVVPRQLCVDENDYK